MARSARLERLSIPLVGGLTLCATSACGVKTADDTLMGRWNLVSQRVAAPESYTQTMPYTYFEDPADESCAWFYANNLEIDSDTMGRWVSIEGYIGCMEGQDSSQRDLSITIAGDTLEFRLQVATAGSSDAGEPDDATGGSSDDGDLYLDITCERAGAELHCRMHDQPPVDFVYHRPACDSQDECGGGELCVAQQCVVPQAGDGDLSDTSSTG